MSIASGNRSSATPSLDSFGSDGSSSSRNKRSRSESEEGDGDHYENGRKKRQVFLIASLRISPIHLSFPSRTKPDKPWKAWGRTTARVVDAFTPISLIIHTYLRVFLGRTALDRLNTAQKRYYDSYNLLAAHLPEFASMVADKGEDELEAMLRDMKEGQSLARSADTNGLKKAILDMVRKLYPEEAVALSNLAGNKKTNRGFNHIILGGLLVPVDMNWSDSKVREELAASPGMASEDAWPQFFYPKGQFDPEDLIKGLLRGELLVWTYKYIYVGPSSWYSSDESKTDATRQGNAVIHRMDSVTPRSLAYVASQVHFALSSGESNNKINDSFSPTNFFWHVLEYLEDPSFETEVKELMEWWNREIFPEYITEKEAPKTKNSLQVMKAQAAARAARAGRTNEESNGSTDQSGARQNGEQPGNKENVPPVNAGAAS